MKTFVFLILLTGFFGLSNAFGFDDAASPRRSVDPYAYQPEADLHGQTKPLTDTQRLERLRRFGFKPLEKDGPDALLDEGDRRAAGPALPPPGAHGRDMIHSFPSVFEFGIRPSIVLDCFSKAKNHCPLIEIDEDIRKRQNRLKKALADPKSLTDSLCGPAKEHLAVIRSFQIIRTECYNTSFLNCFAGRGGRSQEEADKLRSERAPLYKQVIEKLTDGDITKYKKLQRQVCPDSPLSSYRSIRRLPTLASHLILQIPMLIS